MRISDWSSDVCSSDLESHWMIVQEYIRADGGNPFRDWFDSLDPQAAAKVTTGLLRLELGNVSNVKWIGGGLGEYRIDWGPGYRLSLMQDGEEDRKSNRLNYSH